MTISFLFNEMKFASTHLTKGGNKISLPHCIRDTEWTPASHLLTMPTPKLQTNTFLVTIQMDRQNHSISGGKKTEMHKQEKTDAGTLSNSSVTFCALREN